MLVLLLLAALLLPPNLTVRKASFGMPLPQTSSVRDRTSEFLAIAERLQRQQSAANSSQGSSSSYSKADGPSRLQQHSEFAKKASEIGYGIHKTSLKLQKLAQLAKRTSMFDDPAHEVDELTGVVKTDIQAMNAAIAELERTSLRNKEENKQSQNHSHTVVDNLRSRLKDATQEFKDVLTMRTENLKVHKERRQLFSSDVESDVAVPLLPRVKSADKSAHSLFGGSGQAGPSNGFLQQQLVAPQDTYLNSRAEALRNVEATILELGSIFQRLSAMVAEQGELAVRIDENIDDTLSNVENAQTQLLKYLNSISSNKWLILKVFFVLLVFLVVFVVFVA